MGERVEELTVATTSVVVPVVSSGFATLDPAHTDSTVTLSGGDLRAAGTGVFQESSYGTAGKSSGLWYFEASRTVVGAAGSAGIGVGRDRSQLSYVGVDATGYGGLSDGYKSNNGYSLYGVDWDSLSDIVQVAVDLTTHKLWLGKNGVWMAAGNPATGANPTWSSITAGTYWPVLSVGGVGGAGPYPTLLANFGGLPFAYAPPTGFAGWTDP